MPQNNASSTYAALSAEDKGVVDHMIFTEILAGDALASIPQHAATREQQAYHVLMDSIRTWSSQSSTPEFSAYGEKLVEERRELYAANPAYVASARAAFLSKGTTVEEMARITGLVDRMIALDGDQHTPQTPLPRASKPGTTPQR